MWLVERTATCVDTLTAQHVAQVWPVDLPRPKAVKAGTATWTDDDIDCIAAALAALEAKHDLPFGVEDPKVTAERRAELQRQLDKERRRERDRFQVVKSKPAPVYSGEYADPDDVTFIGTVVTTMRDSTNPDEVARMEHVQNWQRQGSNANVSWKIGGYAKGECPLRLYLIVEAAIACVELIDLAAVDPDHRVRPLLGVVLGDDDLAAKPTTKVGAMFGLLTADQARQLAAMAEAAG